MGCRRAWPAVVLLALFAAEVAHAVNVGDVVRKVQERYDATHDFTADVTQEMTVASLGKTLTAHGHVAFKKPGKMRWELTQDDHQLIVADGTTLWFYQPDEHQVLKAPFDAAFRSSTPISFLTGVGRIAQDFDVQADGESPDGTLIYLMLVPRRQSGDVGKLRLSVARDGYDIRAAEIFDPLGNVSRLHFDNLRRNVGVPDGQFVFHVPPGVDVITAPIGQ